MKPEFVPIYAASISAIVAFLVAFLTSGRAVRLEADKIRLATQQTAFGKILDVRIREYPQLYALLSDLPKALERPSTVSTSLDELLRRINVWDSQYSIFFGPDTTNVCYAFRSALRAAIHGGSDELTDEVLGWAAKLELALRSDLGIHGIGYVGADLSPRGRERY